MARIIAIDYGKKRTGLAITDPTGLIASPLTTVTTHELLDYMRAYFLKEEVTTIVVGYPRTLRNEASEMIKYINPFVNRLKKVFPDHRIELVDERFTSVMAMQAMIEGGMKKKDRQNKANVDKISASLILQSYLRQQENKTS